MRAGPGARRPGVHPAGHPAGRRVVRPAGLPEAGAPPTGILKSGPLRFRALVGTGGVGSGSFFLLAGNHTLGREESRAGRYLDRRDYCKLHIVAHYLKVLLGDAFRVVPLARLGADAAGRELRREMAAVGLDLRHVEMLPGERTLFSFCFLYPDGGGGNLTMDDSACARVTAAWIAEREGLLRRLGKKAIVLAVPEVPLAARAMLLELATRHGCFRAASFTRGEMGEAREAGLLGRVDLLAVNLQEAAAAAGIEPRGEPARTAAAAIRALAAAHPRLWISVTAGRAGSWSWDGRAIAADPAAPVRVATTAGAGDAHLAGILAGLAAGLPLAGAQELGTLLAGASVTSPHTIHPGIDRALLREVAAGRAATSAAVLALLG